MSSSAKSGSVAPIPPGSSSIIVSKTNNVTTSAAIASSGGHSNIPMNQKTFRSQVTALWERDETQLEAWMRLAAPRLTPASLLNLKLLASALPSQLTQNSVARLQQQQQEYIHMALYNNAKTALKALHMEPLTKEPVKEEEEDDDEEEEPHAKRHKGPHGGRNRKRNNQKRALVPQQLYKRVDPYQIWLHVPVPTREVDEDDDNDDNDDDKTKDDTPLGEEEDLLPETLGAQLSQLGVAGLVNALSLVSGGYVHQKNITQPKEPAASVVMLQFNMPATGPGGAPATLTLTALQIYQLAVTWHNVLQAQVRQDILVTTPLRIQDMLAADLSAKEFASIRERIFDTVILGKGIHVHDKDFMREHDDNLATANSSAVLEIEKFKKCPTCGNNDQSSFVLDRKNGDVICSVCGTVVSESLMHEGSAYRKFEGEEDRNHHGMAPNSLYSNAHNMSTTLSGVQQASGAGVGGWRSGEKGGGRNLETILRNAHDYIELNVSQLGKTDRRTRIGYKDRQKREAFVQMGHVGDALSLHEAVVQRAKEIFAGFRDDRELVQQFKGVVAACLCEAFEQLSSQGLNIMKGDDVQQQPSSSSEQQGSGSQSSDAPTAFSKRAARRNELHHAKLAGKGGLLLDFSEVKTTKDKKKNNGGNTPVDNSHHSGTSSSNNMNGAASPSSASALQNALEEKPYATWDLESCRSWLLEASRRIAQQWVEDRSKSSGSSSNKNSNIPSGTLEELEGKLVEHSFTLCEQLEAELQARSNKHTAARGVSRQHVNTPRIDNMGKIGIRWQHNHERGSGGKGGVGGSGTVSAANKNGGGRTAGQALFLKTAKKLGSILKDPVAGDAIHKELRAVVGKQEARKLKDRRQEASRQRLQQMKRKPWLQKRLHPGS